MLNFLVWIVIGGLVGLAGSYILYTYKNPGLRTNIVIGMVGALLAGLLLAPLFRFSTFNPTAFSYPAMMMAILGGVTMVSVAHLVRRGLQRAVQHA